MERFWAIHWMVWVFRTLGVLGALAIMGAAALEGEDVLVLVVAIFSGLLYLLVMLACSQFMEWALAMKNDSTKTEENTRVSAKAMVQLANRRKVK